jgi:NADH dehydrogenase
MVIDRMNHHMFQPLFYQVATGRIEPSNIFSFQEDFPEIEKHPVPDDRN